MNFYFKIPNTQNLYSESTANENRVKKYSYGLGSLNKYFEKGHFFICDLLSKQSHIAFQHDALTII